MKRYGTVIALLVCLAACGGGGGAGVGSGVDPRLARLDVYEAQKLRVLGNPAMGVAAMPATELENIPTIGSTTFMGSATIRVENGATPTVLFGDSELTVGFDTNDASGTLGDFFGNDASGAVVDYEGTIHLSGDIDPAAWTLDYTLDYTGVLSTPRDTLNLAGRMDGVFLGNPLDAFAAADLAALVGHNGTRRDATIVVIGEVSVPP